LRVIEKTAVPSRTKSILDLLFGRPLSSEEDKKEAIGPATGIPVFGLDALSSAAYGPEAALTVLAVLGMAGIAYIVPISLAIIILLSIVYFSYRQTIAAYPNGAGSYIVATANLGRGAGLLAGTALLIDYTLNVAVGISAGVGAIVSAVPKFQSHTLALCLGILVVLTVVNLRGVRDAGLAFMAPTYLFVGCLGAVMVAGVFKVVAHGGHPMPVAPFPHPQSAMTAVSLWLLLKAFASGCTAMTGVEAVSNGVQAFRDDKVKNARITLTTIIAILIVLLAGIAFLCRAYGIGATPPGQSGYQSVLSQLTGAVAGRGIFYFISMVSILTVLSLSANTSFADFPRLCHFIAEDGYLPYLFAIRGRRLVFSFGIYVLAFLSGCLLIAFRGVTDRLIPLFAVGAFVAFTLSQAGMVMHWKKAGGRGSYGSMLINGIGALATGLTTCIVIIAKFTEGAWITVLAMPLMIWLMVTVHRHYEKIIRESECHVPAPLKPLTPPLVVLPLQRWSKVADKALRFAYTLSRDLLVVHIAPEDDSASKTTDELLGGWSDCVEKPAAQAGLVPPELVVLRSPYRLVIGPIINYVLELERKNADRQIAVLVPELIERRWYYWLLHNQRAMALKIFLYAKGTGRIIVINVPWYLRS
jgi:amino acid transporter